MAKIDLKFLECLRDDSPYHIRVNYQPDHEQGFITIDGFSLNDNDEETDFNIWLDKSTAIKFAKTLRTEINKIKD